jgi:chemotaxis protein methyltransferase CheR
MARTLPASTMDQTGDAREFVFEAADFQNIAAMLYADSGIFLSGQKAPLVYGRLVKRLRALGIASFKEYCAFVADKRGIDERQQMLSALTTNVTAFFRERHHFDHLRSVELPKLQKIAREGGRVRLWSAGCSKGHEPYSIAMTLLEGWPDAGKHDVKILATDIDPIVLETARSGVYAMDELADIPKRDLERHFAPVGAGRESFAVGKHLRDLISFRELNLVGNWPMKGRFEVIFCRNVAIYFDEPTQAKVWSRFASTLVDGGLLCIGHSERLSGAAAQRLEPTGTTMYRLTRGGSL